MADSKLAQRTAEPAPNPNGALITAMRLGFIRRAEMESARSTMENVLWIRDMLSTGSYKELVDQAKEEGLVPRELEPRRALFKMAGISEDTFHRREMELKAVGAEAIKSLRDVGASYKEIRMLAEAPEEIRREVKSRAAGGITPEVWETITGKLVELSEGRLRAREAQKQAEADRDKIAEKLQKASETIIEKSEHVKKLEAELKLARTGEKTADQKDIDARMDQFRALMKQAAGTIADVDFRKSPYARAACVKLVKELEILRANLVHENIQAFEGLEV